MLLKVQPVDPRDMFRGDYVTLSYEFSVVPAKVLRDILSATTVLIRPLCKGKRSTSRWSRTPTAFTITAAAIA